MQLVNEKWMSVPEEVYGWLPAAQYAAKQQKANGDSYTKNADSFAWYAKCE